MCVARKKAEGCDCLQVFQLSQLHGGIGDAASSDDMFVSLGDTVVKKSWR